MTAARKSLVIWLASSLGIAAVIASGVVGYAVIKHGSLSDAIAAAGGRAIVADQSIKLFEGTPGVRSTVSFTLRNISGRPIRIIGSTSSCSCTASEADLPLLIQPGKAGDVRVSVMVKTDDGDFAQKIVFFTDHPSQKMIPLVVRRDANSHPEPS